MAKILFFISLVVFAGVSACLAVKSPQVRGLGQDPASGGMLASNGLPAVAVKPADGMRLVGAGWVDVPVKRAGMFGGIPSAQGWYALHADKNGAQLAAILAEAPQGLRWPINSTFNEHRGARSLRTGEETRDGVQFSTWTFVRPADNDPWMPLYMEKGQGWKGDLLVRQYAWWGMNENSKLVIEYREPLPADVLLPLADDPASRSAFERRADASFTLLRKDGGDMFPEVIAKVERGAGKELKHRRLADVLGEVIEPETLRLRCD